jgi:hypothetical protein
MVLAGELGPILKDFPLVGYRLDTSTIEEINFYLDRVIPILTKTDDLSDQLRQEEKRWFLMPRGVYEEIRLQGDLSTVFLREFPYKEGKGRGRLVLVSN